LYRRASSCLEQALAIEEKAGENHSVTWDRYKRGQIACCRGEYTQARVEFEECLKAFQQMNAILGQAWCIYELGKIAIETEEFFEAGGYLERCLSMFRTAGRGSAWATLQLGRVAIYEGRLRSARKLLERSLATFREMGSKNGMTQALGEPDKKSQGEGGGTGECWYYDASGGGTYEVCFEGDTVASKSGSGVQASPAPSP